MSLTMWIHGSCASWPLAVVWRNGLVARCLVFSFLEHPPAHPGVLGTAAWLITFDRG